MPQFLFLGQRWVNVDKIISVEVRKDPTSGETFVVVCYGAPASLTIDKEDAKRMLEWLVANKVD